MTPLIPKQCDECKNNLWFKKGLKKLHCKAFPNGILEPILTGKFNHVKKYPGQENDIVFEKIKE